MKKFFKRILLVSLVATMTSMLFAGCSKGSITKSTSTTKRFVDKNPKEYKGTITLWSWTDDPKYMIEQFKKVYPNVTVKFTQVGQDYQTKLKTVLQAGTGVPDLFVGELKNVKQWVDTDFWDNLSVAPYNAEDIAKNQMQYVADLGRDANKNLRALSWQATPGGFWYRRSLAKQYFGTDDPDKISKMMSTMDGLLDMGKKIYVQSGGKVSLLPNYQDLYWYVYANRKLPWVENDKLQIDQLCLDFFDTAKQARTEKLDAKLIAWQPAWFSASDNGSVFGYVLPTWGLQYVIKPSAPKTEGDWAISKGPASYFQGGTWMGLSSKSTNKELAWQFLKYVVANKAYVKNYVEIGRAHV